MGGSQLELANVGLSRTNMLLMKAKATAMIFSTPFDTTPPRVSDGNQNKSNESLLSAAAAKKAKEANLKKKLEVSDNLEIF